MADKGIIFSGPMVRALLDGRKTQTRRLLTLRGHRKFSEFGTSDTPGYDWHFRRADGCWCDFRSDELPLPYAVGDRLYVRENFQLLSHGDYEVTTAQPADVRFAATDSLADCDKDVRGYPWRPCIHMPRWASRLWLGVVEIRVQRLQDMREMDCIAEGAKIHGDIDFSRGSGFSSLNGPMIEVEGQPGTFITPRWWFRELWDSLHSKPNERWDDNPWIVAVSFDVHRGNIDAESE